MNLLHRALCAPLLLIACAVAPSAQAADATGGLKLLRYGPLGHEKPGMLDADGNIRDLSGVERDLTPAELTSEGLGEQKQQVVAYEQQSKAMTADEEQVNALEQRRLAAIGAGDVAALRELLTDDYIHVHQVARVDDRETYLKAIQKTPRRTERGPLTIRVYGDMAVLTGEQRNTLVTPIPGIGPLQPTMCTEVAVRQNGKWRFVSTQTTPVMQPGDPAPTLPPPEDVTKEKQGPLTARQQEVVALESRRAAAIAKNDFAALTKVLSDDYIHVYGSGKAGDRASYIEQLKSGPRSYTRGPLTVRLYGDSAVVSGWLINSIRFPNKPEMTYQVMVTQVAHRVNGNWQFVSQHMTPKMDIPKG
jgi:ketosteroid isomerase-like protein